MDVKRSRVSISDNGNYMCGYCSEISDHIDQIMQHSLCFHADEQYKYRVCFLCEVTAQICYQSRQKTITFKEKFGDKTKDAINVDRKAKDQIRNDYYDLLDTLLDKFDTINRKEDFLSLLKVISKGQLQVTNCCVVSP